MRGTGSLTVGESISMALASSANILEVLTGKFFFSFDEGAVSLLSLLRLRLGLEGGDKNLNFGSLRNV